jgi:hypothetical protein
MPRAKELGDETMRLNVWVDAEAYRMFEEMLRTWYPGKTRVQGAVVGRAIRLLYKQFQKEQRA